jgi:uncharacterized protein HemY
LYLQQQRWPELETLLAELAPHAPLDANILRARVYLARQDFSAARALLEDVSRQAPHLLTAYVFLSHVLLQAGDECAAEPLLRRIVEMVPGQAESWRITRCMRRRMPRTKRAKGRPTATTPTAISRA